jgi:hypothetical protein
MKLGRTVSVILRLVLVTCLQSAINFRMFAKTAVAHAKFQPVLGRQPASSRVRSPASSTNIFKAVDSPSRRFTAFSDLREMFASRGNSIQSIKWEIKA